MEAEVAEVETIVISSGESDEATEISLSESESDEKDCRILPWAVKREHAEWSGLESSPPFGQSKGKEKANNYYLCSMCSHVASRRFRIASHGAAVHGIQDSGMDRFLSECEALSRRGIRLTSRDKVLKEMGPYATSRSTYGMVKNVLQGHLIHVKAQQRGPHVFNSKSARSACGTIAPAGISHRANAISSGALARLSEELGVKESKPDVRTSSGEEGRAFRHPFRPHGRGNTSAKLKGAGLVHSFVGVELCTLSKIYSKLSEASPSDRQLNCQHIHRFIDWATREENCSEEDALSSESLARQFEIKVRDIMMPNSLKNHANSILDMIKLCTSRKQLFAAFPPSKRRTLNKSREEWSRIKRDAEKQARRVQKRKILTTAVLEAPVFWTLCYLQQIRSSGDLKLCLDAAEANRATPRQSATLVCVISSFLALHGQRKCVAEQLRGSELTSAERHHGRFVVRVANHKNTADAGSANVALQESQFEVLLAYAQARRAVSKDETVVRTMEGKVIPRPFEPLLEFVRARIPHPSQITFNLFRKTIETCKKYAGGLASSQCDKIHSYLKHTRGVTQQHYEFQSNAVVCSEAVEVDTVLFQIALFQAIEGGALPTLLPDSALGDFPTKEDLHAVVSTLWSSLDVPCKPISPQTYARIEDFWRERHRDEIVKFLRECLLDSETNVTRPEVNTLIKKKLKPVWHRDTSDLASLVMK